MIMMQSSWDTNGVRMLLAKRVPGKTNHNFLFFPGGPGTDSRYFLPLIEHLNLPGNYWCIDLPGNGSNDRNIDLSTYDFHQWFDLIYPTVNQFINPVYVGHSFGGLFALCEPKLENILSGLVLLNTPPTLWHEAAGRMAIKRNLPPLDPNIAPFINRPSQETFTQALIACSPYYFSNEYLQQGTELLLQLPYPYQPSTYFLNWAVQKPYTASWIPQTLPTLIIGGSEDAVVPFHLYDNDVRFHGDNIQKIEIQHAGHIPWFEKMDAVVNSFEDFYQTNLRQPPSPSKEDY